MIASAGTGSTFGGLQQYLLRGQSREQREGEGLQEYLLSGRSREEADRVAWTSTRNLPCTEPEYAGVLMQATARQNPRVQKPVYHLSLSASPGEEFSREQWERIADRVLRDLKLQEYEVLIVAHRDTKHQHIHLMVNQVHPEQLKAWDTSHDWARVERSLRRLERDWNLREVPGHARCPESGAKTIVPDPERAPLLCEAFEAVAAGAYSGLEALRWATERGLTTRRGKPVSRQTWTHALRNPIYYGRIVVERWGLDCAGKFEPLISEETFRRAQLALDGRSPNVVHHRLDRPEFPLRRFCRCSRCSRCKTPLTGSHSTGKTGKRYRYYRCRNSDCRAVNVRGGVLEDGFAGYLERLRPPARSVKIFRAAVRELWQRRDGRSDEKRGRLERELSAARERKQRLVDLVLDGTLDRATYAAEHARTEERISELTGELAGLTAPSLDLDETLDFATDLLANAAESWRRLEPANRREFQTLLFPEGVRYSPEARFGTSRTGILFSGLRAAEGGKTEMLEHHESRAKRPEPRKP